MGKKLANLFFLFVLILLVLCTVKFVDAEEDEKLALVRKVRCRLRQFPHCFLVSLFCPSTCPYSCLIDCTLCRPVCNCNRPGAVCQDPRFVGGDGITFYFHGNKDRDFCLVSDPDLHINAHFIGKRTPTMKRDFTWVQSIAILFDAYNLFIAAKKTATWDETSDRLDLAFNGSPISLPPNEGAMWHSTTEPRVSITRMRAANGVTVEAEGRFAIAAVVVPITEDESRVHRYNLTLSDDCFAHLDLGFKFYGLSEEVNGVLGQTYRANYTSRVKVGAAMPVLGGEKEFLTSSLFATDCVPSRFNGAAAVKGEGGVMKEHPSLECASGAGGRGVFCKR